MQILLQYKNYRFFNFGANIQTLTTLCSCAGIPVVQLHNSLAMRVPCGSIESHSTHSYILNLGKQNMQKRRLDMHLIPSRRTRVRQSLSPLLSPKGKLVGTKRRLHGISTLNTATSSKWWPSTNLESAWKSCSRPKYGVSGSKGSTKRKSFLCLIVLFF